MKKLTAKRKKYLEIRSKRGLRQKKRNKKFRRERLKSQIGLNLNQRKQKFTRPRRFKPIRRQPEIKRKIYHAPEGFSLFTDTEEVLKFIAKIKGAKEYVNKVDLIVINLTKIKRVDNGALNMLLSAQYEISLYGLSLYGQLPQLNEVRNEFHESGYLNHMKKINGDSFAPNGNHDLILKLGKDHTRNETVGKAINQAVEFLTGTKNHYTPVYSLIMEMAPNSIEHAYEDEDDKEHWILGMHCDEENKKVCFTFTDNGTGIVNTLNRKLPEEIRDKLLGKNVQVLKEAFNKKYGSRTEDINRNKGLPLIKKILKKGKIKNLLLITDNVYLDFEKDSGFLLSNKFEGTFYYWEIDNNCIENEQRRNKF